MPKLTLTVPDIDVLRNLFDLFDALCSYSYAEYQEMANQRPHANLPDFLMTKLTLIQLYLARMKNTDAERLATADKILALEKLLFLV